MTATDRIRKDVTAQVQHAGGDDVLLFAYVNIADVWALLDLADAARRHLDPGDPPSVRCRCENEMAAALDRLDREGGWENDWAIDDMERRDRLGIEAEGGP